MIFVIMAMELFYLFGLRCPGAWRGMCREARRE